MNEIMKIDTVQQYNDYFGIETLHPLVSVVDARYARPTPLGRKLYGVYAVLLKDGDCGSLKYGRSIYDYQQGAMLFIAPGQVMGSEDDGQLHQPKGWILTFHPELLRGTPLAHIMKDYSYFSYSANEALHLSEQERHIVIECMEKVLAELRNQVDKHSKSLIVDNIKLLLDYCVRFYDRQFITRENANHDILTRFENLLDEYFASGASAEHGMPSVQYCADQTLPFGQLFQRPREKGDRLVGSETHPAKNTRYCQRACVQYKEVHQRNIIRTGLPLSAAFQQMVQETGGMHTE